MEELNFGFGGTVQQVEVQESRLLATLRPNPVKDSPSGQALVRQALGEPIGTPRLGDIVKPGEKIAIVTSDITRPLPTWEVMPPLLDELFAAGVSPEDITLVFALGVHRPHTTDEMRKLTGEQAFGRIRCIDGDPADTVHLGATRHGTPVDIVRPVAKVDRRICLGNIEYHYFAGYSGGGKALMPGVSTRAAIQSNHSLMVQSAACAGRLEGNPVRADIEEAAAMVGIDFILNVVLDEKKQIRGAVAGHAVEAHRAGCRFLDGMYKIPIRERADIVVVSQGGAPKDLNLYQTQKALDNAKHAVKPGGVIVLIGSCKEGLGEEVFEAWMTSAKTPGEMVERIGRDFQLGGHKAAAIAMVLEQADIYLVSEMAPDFVRSIFMQPFGSAQTALNAALQKLGPEATVLAMPYGGSTLPVVELGV